MEQQQQQEHIDALLERYLSLLDEYTRLRQDLSKLQSGVYQNIARANFTAERGMRYGRDHYDERMRATRVLRIDDEAGQGVPKFTVRNLMECAEGDEKSQSHPEEGATDTTTTTTQSSKSEDTPETDQKPEDRNQDGAEQGREKSKMKKTSRDPLRWYGLLAPPSLRTAQTLSVQAVEQVIPRLVTVNAEMEHVEIEIRRARKKRAKAAAVADKEALGMEAVEAR
ncbi:hypothetical protein M440DRAFT_1405303 [Trichoderma longibrachiatum ATCC 18648]|uniref:Vacuolar ATPase assembly protein VMA22 n=1 Tax=Trichoderma longibrachiatum ATCC 18648 TaxID=983965 RepID=A0A2T4BU73_TRILO|nr:hypothetical protein M440DRAFT_1405303 [Trichoderma longibrachiatum ATCC 18648]